MANPEAIGPRGRLAERIDAKRVQGLEAKVAQLDAVVRQRSMDSACATIDGLNVLLRQAARGDPGAYLMLQSLERALNQARLLPPPAAPPNGRPPQAS